MNIAVDYGNTTAKVGIFENRLLREKFLFSSPSGLRSFLEQRPAKDLIVSSVSYPVEEVLSWSIASGKRLSLSTSLPLPVRILYATPHSLGVDRIAAVCGALDVFPNKACLVIDAGTCVTFEFLDEHGNYHGGGISPGVAMRFESMHQLTSRLPLVKPVIDVLLVGTSTETCLQSGVINGLRAEIDGIIQRYNDRNPGIQVILCGGDSPFFESHLKHPIFVAPDLVLQGLNRILIFNTTG